MQATKNYIEELRKTDFSQASEISLRTAFENYLNEFITEAKLPNYKILHEGKRIGHFGVPDFRISLNQSMVGYIETKKTDENIDKILKSEQIIKYRELSQNLIVTNYLEFVWIKDDIIHRESLCYLSDLESKKFSLDIEKAQKVEKLLSSFLSQIPEKIEIPRDLALALAVRCRNLKDFLHDELLRQNEQNDKEVLFDLYDAFKNNVFAELTISEFSDAFAQMLAYGLFLAGLNSEKDTISLDNAKKHIPSSFQLIKELINFLDELEKPEYKETKWIIDEIISIINNIEWVELKQNMSFNKKVNSGETLEADPYIYFYETFLATYDYNLRKSKGVYYTPPEVVNFIVRCIDEILINTFKLPGGFADRNKVTVLDFATGTGTFLLEVFKIILKNIPEDAPEKRKMIIKDHILQNLYGFEYLIAPYTIAHLKLSQYLKENGYEFSGKDRLQVYLTNTLEPVDKQIKVPFMPQLSKETKSAQEIKDKPILVVLGNPPYSGHSKNNGEWIKNEIKNYTFVDDKPLGERNPKTLQDDYVKFIRFAQNKMDHVEQGVVGIITNHSFLDNLTFRGMRQSLLNTFDQLHFIDLHGNAKKKEKTPDGEKDQNVFDIEQGVCISLFVKKKGLKKGVFHTDFWGERVQKLNLCLENSLKTVSFDKLKPNSPFYLFVPQNQELRQKYEKFRSVKDIFELNNVGIVTSNDSLAIDFSKVGLEKRFQKIKESELHHIKQEYKLTNKYFKERKDFFYNLKTKQLDIREINYRPFDKRFIWWDSELIERSRASIMKHFDKENIGLVTVRQVAEGIFNHAFISDTLINYRVTLSNKGGAYIFPLYRYNGNGNGTNENFLFKDGDKKDNFKADFRSFLKNTYKKEYTPEQILGYIYAILHSETYRNKYSEFLKMDFPRIPFVADNKKFEKILKLGRDLYETHLNPIDDSNSKYKDIGVYKGIGDNIVIKPEFKFEVSGNKKQYRLYINKTQYFETITEDIFNFSIGGYQVIDKFIKDRKGMDFYPFFVQVENIIKSIAYTIEQMKKIDTEVKEII